MLPYVLFALFPLYFMLVTSLKSNAELYDLNAVPFWISRGLTAEPLRAPVDGYAVLELVRQQPDRQLGVDGDLGRLRRARRVPAGAAPVRRGQLLRGGDFRHLPGAALAPVPAAQHRGELARPLGHPVGADRNLPDLPCPVLYLAPHWVLPHRTQGNRGMRHARRVQPVAEHAATSYCRPRYRA